MNQGTTYEATLEELYRLEYQAEQDLLTLEARERFDAFVMATDDGFDWNFHHRVICDVLQKVIDGKEKRVIITMPPRHGKSELVSRKFPAYALGRKPDDQILLAAHSDPLAMKFSRATQKLMKSNRYAAIFPDSHLVRRSSSRGVQTRLTNKDFELPNSKGMYKCGGIFSGFTGEGANGLIIDDPIKNRQQAESLLQRDRIWEEYTNVLRTRIMPGGWIVICQTRWHEDDLIGRLLAQDADPSNVHKENWTVINLEAIKETASPYDPRELGEALWPQWYPLEVLETIKAAMETDFTALFQGRPTDRKGNLVQRDWFSYYDPSEVRLGPPNFYIDSADEDQAHNDRTAILGFYKKGNDLYLTYGAAKRAKFPERVRWIEGIINDHGNAGSLVWIEPKSSGPAMFQYWREGSNLNIIKDSPPKGSKETRLKGVSPRIEAGRVWLPKGAAWTVDFLNEVCGFPAKPFDDYVDCLIGAVNKTLGGATLEMSTSNYDDH